MQEKSESHSEFSERTEALARLLSKNLSDLPELIGVSASMFYAYRSGGQKISGKAWRKLETAEKSAGIGVSQDQSAKDAGDTLREEQPAYGDKPPLVRAAESMVEHVEELGGNVAELKKRVAYLEDLITTHLNLPLDNEKP